MSLDQASNSSLSQSSFQPFDSLPDEVLLLLLDQMTPFQRCLILSICRKWKSTILQRTSWWQCLDVPYHLPFSTALSILQTFNSRSSFTLKHVVLQPILNTSEEVDEVFAESEKSSGHVQLLFLNQSDFMLKARRAARKFLPKLDTFNCSQTTRPKSVVEAMWVVRDSIWAARGVHDEEEKDLRFFHVAWLEQLEPADLEWFSTLKYLNIKRTDSVKNLCTILEVSKRTLRRLRLDLWEFDEDLEDIDPIQANGLNKINFSNLLEVYTPISEASAAALSTLIDVGGEQTDFLLGYAHALLHFDFPSLQRLFFRFRLYASKNLEALELDEEESKLKTILFFERNPSISRLSLDRFSTEQDGESFHLDFILQSFSIKKATEDSSETEEKLPGVPLPKLRWLTINNPKTLQKKLFKQVWETRKGICKNFEMLIYMEGKVFSIDSSEGEQWLNKAESCE